MYLLSSSCFPSKRISCEIDYTMVSANISLWFRISHYLHLNYTEFVLQAFQGQPTPSTAVTVPHPPAIRPRVRARRGQATDPHSIAERVCDLHVQAMWKSQLLTIYTSWLSDCILIQLRRERISERIKALQELVPSCNKVCNLALLNLFWFSEVSSSPVSIICFRTIS